MKIINKSRNIILAKKAVLADTFLKRIKGLIGKESFSQGEALVIIPCKSIHSFFMRFPIEVVFLNKENKVIKIISPLKPYRLTGIYFSAYSCIEFPLGTLEETVSLGDILEIQKQ